MENQLLETFAYGIGHGTFYIFTIGFSMSILDLIYETALEKKMEKK